MDYLWEAKNLVNKVKHAVLNLTEMESKVMDATNDDKWGASSTLMQEIAKGTHHFQQFNEIMNILVKRLSEREPYNWRKVYKALTLLEYLVKNGSEKVVDFARSNLSLIKVLRNFHCIDEKGKDQGINVKNRAKEIVELLSSTERIKEERKKAKSNRTKYVGIGSDPSGFGSSFSGNSSSSFGPRFAREELGGGLDFPDETPERSHFDEDSSATYSKPKVNAPLPPTPVVDLLGFDAPQDEWSDFQSTTGSFAPAAPSSNQDDFGDFQSVAMPLPKLPPPSSTGSTNAQPNPAASPKTTSNLWDKHSDLFSLDNLSISTPVNSKPSRPTMDQLKEQLNSQPLTSNFSFNAAPMTQSSFFSGSASQPPPKPLKQADLSEFDSLI
ncbi:Epsin-3, clathrin recruitment and traffic between the Golgi and endosome [Entomophthora muscae]|uniref:Epsin-3, clathrin recruitment and traffic between the Golgi and endosome n=1 Tax=Entomophthora muscae TaxID=34485 RepID=A0ACC2TYE0_9FUNG|nr:Epsin-3, clathrin recruitment and traffic between the Golgi and endosome [Entomophthora muscae]